MIKIILAALAICLIPLLGYAAPQVLPKDVTAFLERRETCDHWRGEEAYDKERRAEINWSICQFCSGVDSQLALLKKKHRADKASMDKLEELEPKIEPRDKTATRRLCHGVKKPSSLDEDQ